MAMADILQVVSDTRVECYVPVPKSLVTSEPPWDARANDMFLGRDILRNRKYNMQSGTQLGEFRPTSLTLFHLALLAHIVHVEYPLYSLFKSQCYWFASTVFSAAQIIDKDLSRGSIPTGGPMRQGMKNLMTFFFLITYMCPKRLAAGKVYRLVGARTWYWALFSRNFTKTLLDMTKRYFYISSELPLFSKF
jgi:hypothetical protein